MQDSSSAPRRSAAKRTRRIYRALLASSIFLAAIGAPILMQGTVVFARTLWGGENGSALQGVLILAASATPLALAGFAWKRTQDFSEMLDDE